MHIRIEIEKEMSENKILLVYLWIFETIIVVLFCFVNVYICALSREWICRLFLCSNRDGSINTFVFNVSFRFFFLLFLCSSRFGRLRRLCFFCVLSILVTSLAMWRMNSLTRFGIIFFFFVFAFVYFVIFIIFIFLLRFDTSNLFRFLSLLMHFFEILSSRT